MMLSEYKEIGVVLAGDMLPFCPRQEPVMRQKYELVSHDQPYFRGLLHNKVRNPTLSVAHHTVHCLDDKNASRPQQPERPVEHGDVHTSCLVFRLEVGESVLYCVVSLRRGYDEGQVVYD